MPDSINHGTKTRDQDPCLSNYSTAPLSFPWLLRILCKGLHEDYDMPLIMLKRTNLEKKFGDKFI